MRSEMSDTTTYPPENVKNLIKEIEIVNQRTIEANTQAWDNRRKFEELETKISDVRKYIKEYLSNGDLTEELEHVASLLDITLTKSYNVNITVEYRGTIEIPMNADINRFNEHIDFEFSAPFSDDWEFDICQDDIELEHEEI
jgi:ribosomal protein S15P/S13E